MPFNKIYNVTSAQGVVLAEGLCKKAAAAMVRELGGPAAATFKAEEARLRFAPEEKFTVGEWAETLRGAGRLTGSRSTAQRRPRDGRMETP